MAIIMAAGLGTRMRTRLPKVLHSVCGVPMLRWVVDVAGATTGARPIVVVSPATGAIREVIGEDATYAMQAEPRGTADAVRAGLACVPAQVDEVVVLSGDVPLLEPGTVTALLDLRSSDGAAVALVSVDAAEPASLGRVVRGPDGALLRVVEVADAGMDERHLTEVNAGIYAFDAHWLRSNIEAIAPSPRTGELYLPSLVAAAARDGRGARALVAPDDGTLAGVNDRVELAEAERRMRRRIIERHQRAGVTVVDPATAWVDGSVSLAEDVTLEPGVTLRGATAVGRDSVIRSGSQLFDTRVGERCVVWASVLESAVVEDDARIGPFAHLRAGSHIGRGVELGNFAEVKASRIGAGSKQHHFSYIGDADVGEGVNIGAGTITANYDGRRKHRTTIADRAFIGSDTVLRAPVTIGEGAVTGAGSVVTHDVEAGQTVVGVPAREHTGRPRVADR
jgi:bifunctional UDP-N-acetylglucosamine pyrophosphorylase/glucosamine-1-phosphate N-acetyltransferase